MATPYTEELGQAYTGATVAQEAARCLLCHDAPCSKGCPASTDPASFIRSVRFRNFKGAAATIRSNNALGAVCARVCPTERTCELACSRTGIDRPIDIGGIQRFVCDFEESCGMEVLAAGTPNGKSVAIVGSGPAGLQAAASLRVLGYAVDIYEAEKAAGGVLRYGIPEYRLPSGLSPKALLPRRAPRSWHRASRRRAGPCSWTRMSSRTPCRASAGSRRHCALS